MSRAKKSHTFMLYLNDGGAHVGDEASHGAVRRQRVGLGKGVAERLRQGEERGTRTTAPIFLLEESCPKPAVNLVTA